MCVAAPQIGSDIRVRRGPSGRGVEAREPGIDELVQGCQQCCDGRFVGGVAGGGDGDGRLQRADAKIRGRDGRSAMVREEPTLNVVGEMIASVAL